MASATGISVKGRQLLVQGDSTAHTFFTVAITSQDVNTPIVRRWGVLTLEQVANPGGGVQIAVLTLWTYGGTIRLPAPWPALVRMYCQWDEAGINWSAATG